MGKALEETEFELVGLGTTTGEQFPIFPWPVVRRRYRRDGVEFKHSGHKQKFRFFLEQLKVHILSACWQHRFVLEYVAPTADVSSRGVALSKVPGRSPVPEQIENRERTKKGLPCRVIVRMK